MPLPRLVQQEYGFRYIFEGAHSIQVTNANIGLSLNTPADFAQGVTTGKLTGHLQGNQQGQLRSLDKNSATGVSVMAVLPIYL